MDALISLATNPNSNRYSLIALIGIARDGNAPLMVALLSYIVEEHGVGSYTPMQALYKIGYQT